jgi:GPH family glycoside/pentoside/hexuronide:cation symporter/oligogalacturonide transporter
MNAKKYDVDLAQMKGKEKLIFAWGDVFGGGAQAMIGVLYLIFLTDVIGLNPAIAATAILISKIWDAVSDPIMGVISDNTRTKIGRRRPFIMAGGFLVLIAFALMWLPIGGWESDAAKVVFAISTFLFYSTISTIIAVPYSSLSAEITTNVKERNQVNVIRLVVSTLASAVCTLVPAMILEVFKAGTIGINTFYLVTGIGFGLFFALPLILIGFFTKERVELPKEKTVFEVNSFVKPLKVKAFRGLVYMYLCQSISMDILSAGIIYYSLYVVRGSATVFLGTFIGVQLLMFPIISKLVNTVDKKKIYYFGLPIAILGFIGVGLYPSDWSVIGAYALTAVTAFGFAGAQLMSWIIFPDAVDAGELKLKERPTGSFSGIMTFIRKTSSAIAIQIFGIMLYISGYVKPTTTNQQPVQPDNALLGIRIAMSLSFVILMTIGYFAARKFVLTNERSLKVRKFLKIREETGLENLSVDDQMELMKLESEIF